MTCDGIVVDHHDPQPVVHESLDCRQFLLLQLVILNGFEGDAAMTALRNPGMKDVFVDQALDRAD
jgi:hypothetical protein